MSPNLQPAKYVANKNAGANVARAHVAGKTAKGSAHVAKGLNHVKRVSAGKMPGSAAGVTLGTSHGRHHVAHPVSGN